MLSRFVEEGSKIELRALQRGLEEKGSRKHGKGVPEPGAADSVGGYPGDLHAHGADQTDTFAGGLGIRHDLFRGEQPVPVLCKDHRPVQKQQRIWCWSWN